MTVNIGGEDITPKQLFAGTLGTGIVMGLTSIALVDIVIAWRVGCHLSPVWRWIDRTLSEKP